MNSTPVENAIGLLFSGGLDSCILLGHLLRAGRGVQPFYVSAGLAWERDERAAAERFLAAIAPPGAAPLVVLEQPAADLYGMHWSLTGRGVPDAASDDRAVYLPGRNALLLVKPALWCALHGIEELALGVLAGNPFADATDDFLQPLAAALGRAVGRPLRFVRPLGQLGKGGAMRLGAGLPLELSFSCIAPRGGLHCGRCNKCAERRAAFAAVGIADPTRYAAVRP